MICAPELPGDVLAFIGLPPWDMNILEPAIVYTVCGHSDVQDRLCTLRHGQVGMLPTHVTLQPLISVISYSGIDFPVDRQVRTYSRADCEENKSFLLVGQRVLDR